jgi:heme o synthase
MKAASDPLTTDLPAIAGIGAMGATDTVDGARSRLADYVELTKPRMNFLVLSTTMVGYAMGSQGWSDWPRVINTLIGTALCAGGAAALNMWMEVERDRLMPRTRNRPLPAGRLQAGDAMGFGLALALGGMAYLATTVNLLTALLGAATIGLYVFVYTPLKRVTSLNTIVGAVPGAVPPVMGFTAACGTLTAEAMAVFAILFLWQMPHFLAIAILYKGDYAAAKFKMLPVVDDDLDFTGRQIMLYSAALVPVSMLPSLLGMTGVLYAASAVVLGMGFFWFGLACATAKTRADARRLFFASIIYLPVLLAVMMIDKR